MAKCEAMDENQLNILCVVLRLEQINDEHPAEAHHWLWDRVMFCDVPRLRAMLTPEMLEWERDNAV
jgi:hypothetical protein